MIAPSLSSEHPVLSPKSQAFLSFATALFLLAAFYFVFSQYHPPAALGVDEPPTEFAAGRAIQHLRVIAQEPRPVGSPGHQAARDYIVSALSELKLSPEVQSLEVIARGKDVPLNVQNIVARLAGTDPDAKAVMLVAHYDSVPDSYGAADDGAGVSTLLETLRALSAGQPLKKDVVALFTDAEEIGLLGAKSFTQQPAWLDSVEIVLNFEARGSSGPAFMFETSRNNAPLIEEFARAAPFPFSNSLAQTVYQFLPNDTDLSVFKSAGYPGLNFAFIGAAHNYHSMNDNVQTIDERSIQHLGSYALALARHFGNLERVEKLPARDAVYFDLLGKNVVSYSTGASLVFTICNIVLFGGISIYGFWKKRLSPGGIALGGVASIFTIVCVAVIVAAAEQALGLQRRMREAPGSDYLYFIFLAALAISAASIIYLYFANWSRSEELSSGALLINLVALAAVTLYLPGASYVFAWPLAGSLAGIAFVTLGGQRAGNNWIRLCILCLAALPTIVVFLWTMIGVFQGIRLRYPIVLMIAVSLLINHFTPLLGFLARPYKWLLPAVSLLAAAISLTLAVGR